VDTSLEVDPATAGDVVHQQHRGTWWRVGSSVRVSVAGCCGLPAPRLALFSTSVLMNSFFMANNCLRLTGRHGGGAEVHAHAADHAGVAHVQRRTHRC
jgi:hypothetical protein